MNQMKAGKKKFFVFRATVGMLMAPVKIIDATNFIHFLSSTSQCLVASYVTTCILIQRTICVHLYYHSAVLKAITIFYLVSQCSICPIEQEGNEMRTAEEGEEKENTKTKSR